MIELTDETIKEARDSGNIIFLEKVPLLSSLQEYRYTLQLSVEGYEEIITSRISVTLAKGEQGVQLWWYPKEKESELQMCSAHEDIFTDEKRAHSVLKGKAHELLLLIQRHGLRYRSDSYGDKDWYIEGGSRVFFGNS